MTMRQRAVPPFFSPRRPRPSEGIQRFKQHRLPPVVVMELPAMKEWIAEAKKEPDGIDELEAEF